LFSVAVLINSVSIHYSRYWVKGKTKSFSQNVTLKTPLYVRIDILIVSFNVHITISLHHYITCYTTVTSQDVFYVLLDFCKPDVSYWIENRSLTLWRLTTTIVFVPHR